MKFAWMNFPEIGLAHDPKIEISKKHGKKFPDIGLDPEKSSCGIFLDEFSRISREQNHGIENSQEYPYQRERHLIKKRHSMSNLFTAAK